MDEVNVAVIAPILGRDLSFVSDVDARVRVLDANFAAPGRSQVPNGQAEGDADRLGVVLAQAEVLLFGFPVPPDLAARSPRLAWAHHTQAGVSNLVGTDLWDSEVTLTSSRGAMAGTGTRRRGDPPRGGAPLPRGPPRAPPPEGGRPVHPGGLSDAHRARGDD